MDPVGSLQFLEQYGVLILPALVIAEQVGIPLPAVPALLGAGALAAHGRIDVPLLVVAISIAALTTDLVWYELGRRRGAVVLSTLCRLSLEPDSCLRRAEDTFVRHGVRGMLIAKFVPGLTTVMPPLAGVFAVGRVRFVLYDLAGLLLWAGTWLTLGYVFADAITLVTARATALGQMLGLVVVGALAAYVLLKLVRRRLFLRKLRMARISPAALKLRLDGGEDVAIIDLRTPLDVAATPYAIPGSRWLAVEAIDKAEAARLRTREVVLYCACPNEATSARVALLLQRQGITRVRPLEGGIAAWMELGFPVLAVDPPAVAVDERAGRVPSRAA